MTPTEPEPMDPYVAVPLYTQADIEAAVSAERDAAMALAANRLRQMDADRVMALRWRADAEAAVSDLRAARAESVSARDLVSRIRWALGDNGLRTQDELIEWCREIARERTAR